MSKRGRNKHTELILITKQNNVELREALINDAVSSDTCLLPGSSDASFPVTKLFRNLCVRVLNSVRPAGTTETLPFRPCLRLCLSPMESPCSAPSPDFRAGSPGKGVRSRATWYA